MKRLLLSLCVLFGTLGTLRAQYSVDTIHASLAGSEGLNVVILSEGYIESQLTRFKKDCDELVDSFFRHTPWKEYKTYINFFSVPIASNVKGAGQTPDNPIDNVYGTCFGTSGVDRMPWPTNWTKVNSVLNRTVPDHDMVIILINQNKYGGGGGGGFVCLSNFKSGYWVNDYFQIIIHEAGHALGDLADEYWYDGRERPNQTKVSSKERVKWKNWIGKDKVGVYPYEESPDWYRPHQNCLMRYLGQPYCDVCREALIEAIHQNVKPILSYEPDNKKSVYAGAADESITFSLNLLKPSPNSLHVNWKLDSKTMEGEHEDVLTIPFDSLESPGRLHLLTASVEDQSKYLLVDNHASIHVQTVTWRFKREEDANAIEVVSSTKDDITLSPLPFADQLTVRVAESGQPFTAQLCDLSGRVVASGDDVAQVSFTTSSLPEGVYVVRLIRDGQVFYSRKVTK